MEAERTPRTGGPRPALIIAALASGVALLGAGLAGLVALDARLERAATRLEERRGPAGRPPEPRRLADMLEESRRLASSARDPYLRLAGDRATLLLDPVSGRAVLRLPPAGADGCAEGDRPLPL